MQAARVTMPMLLLTAALTGSLLTYLSKHFRNPYPPMPLSLQGSKTELQDVLGVTLGIRRLAADLAWIQTLQYYGTPEPGQTDFAFHNGMGVYADFLDHCRHVSRIDPYFTYVYYYGGSVLGWNLNRLSEAEQLLREGIAHNPTEWRLPQYLAGLAYQKNHDSANLMKFLESITKDPECPLLMQALLANLYKKQHRYVEALRMWERIYSSGDPSYRQRAREQFQAIHALLNASKRPPTLTK
ncbi:MAG: hypothetical protein A2992_08830 [Elusimicrobia bacterium RIFCSPLOWO2_01_FULL_59_12]|nr:MAG: hypothetical protein A2992_08830 [Elusimicrobia bacterium RIFCSPLOWO2_01_FULL_59_12]